MTARSRCSSTPATVSESNHADDDATLAAAERARQQLYWMVLGALVVNVILFLLAAHWEESGQKPKGPVTPTNSPGR